MTAASLEIRLAHPDDAAAIAALVCALASYALADPSRPEDAADFFAGITETSFDALLRDPRFRFHVAVDHDELVAIVAMRDDTHLYHLFVAEDRHGQGLGKRLWHVAKDDTMARGHDGPFTVNASLWAVPVYERFGFVPTDTVQTANGVAFVPMILPS